MEQRPGLLRREGLHREVGPGGGDSDAPARGELEDDPRLISFPEAIPHRPEPGSDLALVRDDADNLSLPG